MLLGEKISKLRAAKGWSSGELAQNSSVSRAYLWQLEKDPKKHPSVHTLAKLAKALGVPVTEFIENSETQGHASATLPSGLADFVSHRGPALGVTKTDVEVMRNIHFRGAQPDEPDDWELLFLFLRKWARRRCTPARPV